MHMPRLVYSAELTCNLPPPNTLNIDAIGTNWVNVSWPIVIGAVQYRLQAFDALSGDGLATAIFVPGTATSATVSTAGTSSGTCYVRIWSVCEGGEYEYNNFTQSDNFETIVIDLVVNGYRVLVM